MPSFKSCLALLLSLCVSTVFAAGFSSLEERMSGDEFDAAGLARLSPDELAQLNEWLRTNWPTEATAATPYPATVDARGLPQQSGSRDTITSRIIGEFTGWNGSSIFRLENGMVWQAKDPSASLVVRPMSDPTVIIEPAVFNTWLLRVEGYNATVRVRRIE